MEELIKEFRKWQKSWDNYNGEGKSPMSKEEFTEKLEGNFLVTKIIRARYVPEHTGEWESAPLSLLDKFKLIFS